MNDKHERPELFPWEMTAREFRATLTICKAAYGSRRWTAQDRNGQTVYFVPRPFVSAQGQAIYPGMGPCCFERKRDLLAAMDELHCAAVKYALRSGKSLCAAVRAEYPLLFPPLDEDMPFRPCCGCGYCCAQGPCLLAAEQLDMALLRDWTGCPFLRWHDGRYWCGLVEDAARGDGVEYYSRMTTLAMGEAAAPR